MKKDKEGMPVAPATQEQIEQANEIVNAMAEAGILITEEGGNGEKLLEVTLAGGVKVICELDENNRVKNNRGVRM